MIKAVVTGGSGFIGSNLVNFLIKKKFFIINIDKLTYSSNKLEDNLKNQKNYKFYKADICNKKQIFKIFKKHKPKVIFNLAAETHVDRSIDSPKEFINTNIIGVFNILEGIRFLDKQKIRTKLIHVSTDEVYGDINVKERSTENYKYNPSSPYSASKASADHLIKSYIRTFKINAIISNCCNNYGPFQFPEKLIPKIILNIFNNKKIPLYGSGKNSREWLNVEDHCKALLKLFLKGKSGESYNIGSGINLTNIDLIKKIFQIYKSNKIKIGNKSKIVFVKDRPGHDFRYALNSKKILKKLNWKPQIKINEGLNNTINWYSNNKKFLKNISNKIYEKRLGLKL